MSVIDIIHPTCLEMDEARAAVVHVAAKLNQEYELLCQWQGNELRFSRNGVKGSIQLLPQQVHVKAELGFPFSVMRDIVESGIRKTLSEKLG